MEEISLTPQAEQPNPTFQPTPVQSKPSKKGLYIGLAVVVLILLALAGTAYAYRDQVKSLLGLNSSSHNPSTASSSSTPASPSAQPDPYSGWKTYQGNGYSFRYPADWKIITDMADTAASPDNHFVRLKSSTQYQGNNSPVNFYLGVGLQTVANASDSCGSNCKVVGVEPFTSSNNQSYYILDTSFIDLKVPNTNLVGDVYLTSTKANPGDIDPKAFVPFGGNKISINGGYGEQSLAAELPLNTWNSLPEVKTAKLIIKSLSFQK